MKNFVYIFFANYKINIFSAEKLKNTNYTS